MIRARSRGDRFDGGRGANPCRPSARLRASIVRLALVCGQTAATANPESEAPCPGAANTHARVAGFLGQLLRQLVRAGRRRRRAHGADAKQIGPDHRHHAPVSECFEQILRELGNDNGRRSDRRRRRRAKRGDLENRLVPGYEVKHCVKNGLRPSWSVLVEREPRGVRRIVRRGALTLSSSR